MQSRKDQVQAYFFVVGRLVAAVTHGRPEVLEAPTRRLKIGTVLGVLAAVLLMAIFTILGMFLPSKSDSWRTEGAIVMEKDTGARFVYLQGQLRPVANYSSAMLASGGGEVVSASQKSLSGTPVGQPIGIPNAPDSIPTPETLEPGPWTVCVRPGSSAPVGGEPQVTLELGAEPGTSAADNQGMLVSTPDDAVHLVWRGKRFRINNQSVIEALGYGDKPPVKVSPSWLNPIPAGRDLEVPSTPGIGEQGVRIDGQTSIVGQVYEVRNPAVDSPQFYLVRQDGVAPLNKTSAALVFADEATRNAYPDGTVQPIQVGPTALSGVQKSTADSLVNGFPPSPPEAVVPPSQSLPCVRYASSGAGEMKVSLELRSAPEVNRRSVPTPQHIAGQMADRIVLPAGHGVLARSLSAPGAPPGTAYLITDVGRKFPLANKEVLEALGYSESMVMQIPDELLALLPEGPVLSTEAAVRVQAPQQ